MRIECVATMTVYNVYEREFKDKDGNTQKYYRANCEYDNSCEELGITKEAIADVKPLAKNDLRVQVDTIGKTVRIIGVVKK